MADATADHGAEEREGQAGGTPILEWLAGGIGALLTLGLLGFLGWQAWRFDGGVPPELRVELRDVVPAGDGWVAEFAAVNGAPVTAAAVEVEGVLLRDGEEVERSTATLDYVPGESEARGGLVFAEDPASGALRLRALGYAEP